jgi:hypothetical protein
MHPGARGGGYGLDADLANKASAKMDQHADAFLKAQNWIEQVLGTPFPDEFGPSLKDGTILCQLLNVIKPGCVKANASKMPFKQMENVSNYLKVSRALGVKQHDCFETVDLYEQKDLLLVALQIHALGAAIQVSCPEFQGPKIGVKIAEKNVRQFTAEQIKAQKANSGMTLQNAGSYGIMERTELNKSNDINFGNKNVGTGSSEMTAQTMGSAGIMERGAINVSNDINFGNKSAGTGSNVATAQTMGSAGIMERGAINVSNDINFGAKSAGTGSNVATAQTMGSAGIMERGAINVSNDINFGNKASGGAGSAVPSMVMQGSQGVMERSEVTTSNDINFGSKQAGEETIFDGMSKLAMGSQGVMERSEVQTSNDINFGAKQDVSAPVEAAAPQEVVAPVEEVVPQVAPVEAVAPLVVKALYDYVPAEEGELAFSGGDDITVTHKDESGWWTGTNPAGQSGVFPANYTDGV